MAGKKNQENTAEEQVSTKVEPVEKELNMNDKSKVKNLCAWNVSWERESIQGDEFVKASSTVYITNSEIESQVLNGNRFFCGTDDIGSHAKVYIENPQLREYLKFDNKEEGRTQLIIDDKECKKILAINDLEEFKKSIEKNIVTNSEKSKIMIYARDSKLNDYSKIEFLEKHCDLKFRIEE